MSEIAIPGTRPDLERARELREAPDHEEWTLRALQVVQDELRQAALTGDVAGQCAAGRVFRGIWGRVRQLPEPVADRCAEPEVYLSSWRWLADVTLRPAALFGCALAGAWWVSGLGYGAGLAVTAAAAFWLGRVSR